MYQKPTKDHSMKTFTIFRIFPLSLALILLGAAAMAQSKDEQAAKEAEMKAKQEQIEFQRQQMKEQQVKTMELEKVYAEQARAAARARSAERVYIPSTGISGEPFFYSFGQENQSQLTLRNSFNGETVSSAGDFVVDDNISHIRLTINGKVRHGEISVRVLLPDGKKFKDLTINSSAEIAFSQSLTLKDEDKNKYVGAWKYEVKTKTAEGNYSLSIMTH